MPSPVELISGVRVALGQILVMLSLWNGRIELVGVGEVFGVVLGLNDALGHESIDVRKMLSEKSLLRNTTFITYVCYKGCFSSI